MIQESDFIQLIKRFQRICIEKYPDDLHIIPINKRISSMGYDLERKQILGLGFRDNTHLVENIFILVKTPRLLKQILRKVDSDWQALHGEVDFDHVFIARVLMFSAPEAFEFILQHINSMRILQTTSKEEYGNALKDLYEIWNSATEKVLWNKTAALNLIQFMFPFFSNGKSNSSPISAQGFQVYHPNDYWNRFIVGRLICANDSESDQEIFQIIKNCGMYSGENKNSKTKLDFYQRLFELLHRESFSEKFEYLAKIKVENKELLSGEDVRNISSTLFDLALKKYTNSTTMDSVVGINSLFRLSCEKPIKQEDHQNWLLSEIKKSISISLSFATELYLHWKRNSYYDPKIGEFEATKKMFFEESKKLYSSNVNAFIQSVNPLIMSNVFEYYSIFTENEEGEEDYVLQDLSWLINLLLEAGKINPQVIIPQLVRFVTKTTDRGIHITYSFDKITAEELFKDKYPEFISMMKTRINSDCFSEPHQFILLKILEEIQQLG